MIKVTFEFPTIDAAIVAMGKMVGAPVASRAQPAKSPEVETPVVGPDATTSRKRKPRNDAGKPRGPYKEPAAPAVEERNDKADTLAPVAAAQSLKSPVEAVLPDVKAINKAVPSAEDAQEIFAKVFDAKGIVRAKELLQRYGVGRVRELLEAQRADFIAECNGLLKEAA